MILSEVTLRSKLIGFSVLSCSIMLALSILLLPEPNVLDLEFWRKSESFYIMIAAILLFFLGYYPISKIKLIQMTPDRIMFHHCFSTTKVKEVKFRHYDYYQIVTEHFENGKFEAVWIIKNQKLKYSFSNYDYVNYEALKLHLKIPYKGVLEVSPMKQLMCRCGAKI